MVIRELVENETRVRHYSDSGFYILQNETGIEYEDAVDVLDAPYTYSETDKVIEVEETEGDEYGDS